MSRKISLFVVPGMEGNVEALKTVRHLPDTQVEEVPCPTTLTEWFDLPFVRDEDGISYYGIEGITSFAEAVAADVNGLATKARNGSNGNGRH